MALCKQDTFAYLKHQICWDEETLLPYVMAFMQEIIMSRDSLSTSWPGLKRQFFHYGGMDKFKGREAAGEEETSEEEDKEDEEDEEDSEEEDEVKEKSGVCCI